MDVFGTLASFIGGLVLGSLAGLFALPVVGTIVEAMKDRTAESFGLAIFVFALFGAALGYTLWITLLSAPVAAGGVIGFWNSGKALLRKD